MVDTNISRNNWPQNQLPSMHLDESAKCTVSGRSAAARIFATFFVSRYLERPFKSRKSDTVGCPLAENIFMVPVLLPVPVLIHEIIVVKNLVSRFFTNLSCINNPDLDVTPQM